LGQVDESPRHGSDMRWEYGVHDFEMMYDWKRERHGWRGLVVFRGSKGWDA